MNKTRNLFHIISTLLLAVALFPQGGALAAGQAAIDIPLEALHDGEPIRLEGLISSQTVNIPIPDDWQPGTDNRVEFTLKASNLLDLERASLTISLNGSNVRSLRVTAASGTTQSISLPADMFTQGNNTLTFTGMLYLPSDQDSNCQNWDDPSRWLTIEPGGRLHLTYSLRAVSLDLGSFPEAFIGPLDAYLPDGIGSPLFVLPDERTQDDMSALTTLSYQLGAQKVDIAGWQPKVISASQFSPAAALGQDIIFINTLPAELKGIEPAAGKDFVALVPSPWGENQAVLAIGDNDRNDGNNPATVFSNPARSVMLRGNVAYLDPASQAVSQPFPWSTTLEDLGYLDRTVRGVGRQDLIYRLYIPYNVDPSTATFRLSLSHAPDLNTEDSSFLVYLNGFSVAGILPTARSANPGGIEIEMPASRFRPGINYVRISFDLHPQKVSCERAPESVWATIFNSSSFEITFRNRTPVASLEYFPLPFNDAPGAAFVLPDELTAEELGEAAGLAFMLGQTSHLANQPPVVVLGGEFDPAAPARANLIMVGTPSRNPAVALVNDMLPQPFAADGKSLKEGYGVYLPGVDQTASFGMVQVMPSPWNGEGVILVLTGSDAQGETWAWNLMQDPAAWGGFAGNLAVVGSKAQTSPASPGADLQVSSQQTADVSKIPVIGPLLQKTAQYAPLPAILAVAAAAGLIVLAYWILNRLSKRARAGDEPAENRRDDDEK